MILTSITIVAFVALILSVMQILSDADEKKPVFYWTLTGIIFAAIKIFLIQMTPQWADLPLDSVTYQLHAKALYMHWTGLLVDPYEYRLNGYLVSEVAKPGYYWMPGDNSSYTSVFGTHAWLYPAFIAVWQFINHDWTGAAILTNAVMAGALPAAGYLMTKSLNGSVNTCHFAALLIFLDPSTAINSAWLMKDTLGTFLCATAIICTCKSYKHLSLNILIILAVSLGLLGCVRFVAYVALGVIISGLVMRLVLKKNKIRALGLSIASTAAIFIWGGVYFAPFAQATPHENEVAAAHQSRPGLSQLGSALSGAILGQIATLSAKNDEAGADESVIKWHAFIEEEIPLKVAFRSMARTLFAPYPWTLITQKLTGDNHIELYLFGMIFWALALPGIIVGIAVITKQGALAYALITLLIILATAYIIFFGEWSTRQRVFMMPLFFSLSAIGWGHVWRIMPRLKKP